MGVTADDTQIGDNLTPAWLGHSAAGLLNNTHEVVAWRERQWALEVRIASTQNEGVGKARTGGEHLDADLVGAGFGEGRLFRQF